MKPIEWLSNDTFRCRDVRLRLCEDLTPARAVGDEQVTIYKSRKMVEETVRTLQGTSIRRILELGMWDGGSAIFLEHHLELDRFVGVDIQPKIPFLERYIERHQLGERMRIRGNMPQDGEAALQKIFREDFEDAYLDLIIDDASHDLKETRNSFEICFPRLRTGGLYIIEDWGWGHVSDLVSKKVYLQRTPPSPLICELLLASATLTDVIRRVHVNRHFVVIERGEGFLERKTMKLENLYHPRGLPFPWRSKVSGLRALGRAFGAGHS